MRDVLPENLITLAKNCKENLYIVGGSVRDYLANLHSKDGDFDVCSPMSVEDFISVLTSLSFKVDAVYKNTGTVKFSCSDNEKYEFTSFRSDKYIRGEHSPPEIFFTKDITLDAKRRDFKANAVYYDISSDCFVDPLGGIDDVKNKRLSTVVNSEKVFGEDGLRLMRLCRQAGQTGFFPTPECLEGAKKNASLISDIVPERIYTELMQILYADEKYGVKDGQYYGLKLLQETGVLSYILPELELGVGMKQRADFHKYDVWEHTLHAVKYATHEVRLSALLHDVGKPYCYKRDGHVHEHHVEGERISKEILTRLKAPVKTTEEVATLTKLHMYDFDTQTKETKLRRFFVNNYGILDKLMALKQADFSGCTEDTSTCPTNVKWKKLLNKMKSEKVPFTLKELAVNDNDMITLGVQKHHISKLLNECLMHTAIEPKDNEKTKLLRLASKLENNLLKYGEIIK